MAAHRYAEEGTDNVVVTIHHDSAPDVSVAAVAVVGDAALAAFGGFTWGSTEGSTPASQLVAAFTDPGGNEPLDYSASISWGDGSSSTGVIGFDTVNSQFTVAGTHLYTAPGTLPISVTISHDTAPAAVVSSQANISDPAVVAQGGLTVTALEQVINAVQPLATFSDPGGGEAPSGYSARIVWDDGSASTGTITGSAAANLYTVSGQHVFTAEGLATVSVQIQHGSAPGATVTSFAQVADAPVIAKGNFTINASAGVAFAPQTVATFYDPVGNDPQNVYSASIAWGDGATSTGAISFDQVSNTATVAGGHLYAVGGQFAITVTVHHETAADTMTTSQANVAGPPFAATVAPISATDGVAFSGLVATLTDATANGLSVAIGWGDGTTSTGIVSNNLTTVTGSHVYHDEGKFTVTVTVVDAGLTQAFTGTASVAPVPLPLVNPTLNQFFVAELYEDLLARAPELDGLEFWAGQLDQGMPRGNLVRNFEHTPEYVGTIIRPAYQQFLFRPADPIGLAFWTDQMLNHGLSDEQLQADFIGSPEYYVIRGGGTDAGWVTAMYNDLLHRPPDQNGLSFWLGQLAKGVTRSQVAFGFTSSPESEAVWTNGAYFQYLGRAAQPPEVDQAVAEITKQGFSREDVLALVLGMDEYFNHARGG
jgi:hypothetical protein